MSDNGDQSGPAVLRRRIGEALQQVVHEDTDPEWSMAGGVVTKWVVGIEVATLDGDRLLYLQAMDGMKAWDTLGIVELMRQAEIESGNDGWVPDD